MCQGRGWAPAALVVAKACTADSVLVDGKDASRFTWAIDGCISDCLKALLQHLCRTA